MTTACGSPTAPAPPAFNSATQTAAPSAPSVTIALPGVWSGYLSATDCRVGSSTSCPPRLIPFVLRISDAGPAVAALEVLNGSYGVVMDVTGVTQPDGAVVFTGRRGALSSDQANVELRRLLVRLDSAMGLTGEIDLRRDYTSGGHSRVLTGPVVSAAYLPLSAVSAQGVAGTWSGMAVIRTCSGYCPIYLTEGDNAELSLVVGQTGSTLSGKLLMSNSMCHSCWLPVSGSINGTAVSLTSERYAFSAASGDVFHLQSFEGTMDQLGRISGRLVLQADSRVSVSPFNVTYRHEMEILWLTRN